MLSELCLCGLVLFASPGWSKLDTSFLDMDPPMLSWSMTDQEYDEWEDKEYEQLERSKLYDELVSGRPEGNGLDALQMVRDCGPSDVLSGTGAQRAVPVPILAR